MEIKEALASYAIENGVSLADIEKADLALAEWSVQFLQMRVPAIGTMVTMKIITGWEERSSRILTNEESMALVDFVGSTFDNLQRLITVIADPSRLHFGHEGEILVDRPGKEKQ